MLEPILWLASIIHDNLCVHLKHARENKIRWHCLWRFCRNLADMLAHGCAFEECIILNAWAKNVCTLVCVRWLKVYLSLYVYAPLYLMHAFVVSLHMCVIYMCILVYDLMYVCVYESMVWKCIWIWICMHL